VYYNIVVLSGGRTSKRSDLVLHSINNRCILFAYAHSSYCCGLLLPWGRSTVPDRAANRSVAAWAEAEELGTQQKTPWDQGHACKALYSRHPSGRMTFSRHVSSPAVGLTVDGGFFEVGPLRGPTSKRSDLELEKSVL
jgi:hypothetical protein